MNIYLEKIARFEKTSANALMKWMLRTGAPGMEGMSSAKAVKTVMGQGSHEGVNMISAGGRSHIPAQAAVTGKKGVFGFGKTPDTPAVAAHDVPKPGMKSTADRLVNSTPAERLAAQKEGNTVSNVTGQKRTQQLGAGRTITTNTETGAHTIPLTQGPGIPSNKPSSESNPYLNKVKSFISNNPKTSLGIAAGTAGVVGYNAGNSKSSNQGYGNYQ